MSDEYAANPLHSLKDSRVVVILTVTALGITGLDAVAAILPSIADGLVVSDARIGWVMSVFFGMAALTLPFTGALADMYGRRPVVIASVLIFGGAGFAIAFVDSFEAVLILRGLQGIGFAGTTPLSIVLAGDHFTGATGSTVQGLRLSANGLVGIIAPAIAGFLAGLAWHYPFFIFLIALPVAILVFFVLPPVEADGNLDSDLNTITVLRSYLRSLLQEFSDRSLVVFVLGAFVAFFVRYGILTFVPLFAVRELGASVFVVGLLVSLLGLARLVVAPLSGFAVAALPRRTLLIVTIGIVAAGTAAISMVPGVIALAIMLAIYGTGSGIFVPVLNDTVTSMTTTENRAGVVSGMNVFKNVAMALSPAIFGIILVFTGFRMLFLLMAVIPIAYILLLLTLISPPTDAAASAT